MLSVMLRYLVRLVVAALAVGVTLLGLIVLFLIVSSPQSLISQPMGFLSVILCGAVCLFSFFSTSSFVMGWRHGSLCVVVSAVLLVGLELAMQSPVFGSFVRDAIH